MYLFPGAAKIFYSLHWTQILREKKAKDEQKMKQKRNEDDIVNELGTAFDGRTWQWQERRIS